jgi:hypothetical protein
MTLTFPNPCRSFDVGRGAVRFTGYDGMFEVSFYVAAAALVPAEPDGHGATPAEAACLSAFDARRSSVLEAARKAYAARRLPFYTLTAADLP